MTPTAEQREKAREIATCTCGTARPAKMQSSDLHFANCPVELVDDIAHALAAESAAAEERIARLRAMILEGIETIEFASMRAPGSSVWVRRARAALEETP